MSLSNETTRDKCRECDSRLDADGTCPFCRKCDVLGIVNGADRTERRRRRRDARGKAWRRFFDRRRGSGSGG